MTNWALAFVLTLTIEIAVAVPLLGWLGSPATVTRRVVVVALASAITHPLLWVGVRAVGESDVAWTVGVLIGEIVAIGVEAVVLIVGLPGDRPDRPQRIRVAILMNAASALVGLALVALS